MADGMDCTSAAWSENECCCGADWTTQEVYDLRSCVEELERQRDELLAALAVLEDFAGTVASSSSFWEEVWPEHDRKVTNIVVSARAIAAAQKEQK